MATKEQLNVGLQHMSLTTAAQILLARIATNVGKNFATLLNTIALELYQSVPIYGLDGRSKTVRAISAEEIRAASFTNGALVLRTAGDSVFTQLTVRRADLDAYLAGLDRMDAGAWTATKASITAIRAVASADGRRTWLGGDRRQARKVRRKAGLNLRQEQIDKT